MNSVTFMNPVNKKILFDKWALKEKAQIAKTATSDVYLVENSTGGLSVLKLLTDTGKEDERQASSLLDWYEGLGSVKLLRSNDDALLLEYAEGDELSEWVYAGQDEEATRIACSVVRQLHAIRKVAAPEALTPLRSRLSALFSTADNSDNSMVREAASIADTLLKTTTCEKPLHGDLHHHNMIKSGRGWLAIDPKGLIGDPAYEVSNLFANPLNYENAGSQPERVDMLLRICADELTYPKDRIAKFAFVHNVVATIWPGINEQQIKLSLQVAQNIREHFGN